MAARRKKRSNIRHKRRGKKNQARRLVAEFLRLDEKRHMASTFDEAKQIARAQTSIASKLKKSVHRGKLRAYRRPS